MPFKCIHPQTSKHYWLKMNGIMILFYIIDCAVEAIGICYGENIIILFSTIAIFSMA
jgi:hypothetical protein